MNTDMSQDNPTLFLSMTQAEHIYKELGKFLETLKGYSAIGVPVAKLVVSYPKE